LRSFFKSDRLLPYFLSKTCDNARQASYIFPMSRVARNLENPPTVPAGWLESLERSEAQLARGETVPLEPVLELMRASIARMEAKRAGAAKK